MFLVLLFLTPLIWMRRRLRIRVRYVLHETMLYFFTVYNSNFSILKVKDDTGSPPLDSSSSVIHFIM